MLTKKSNGKGAKPSLNMKNLPSDDEDEEDSQIAATMYGGLISHSDSSGEEETKDAAGDISNADDNCE